MGSKYPVLKPAEIIAVLNKFGFSFVSQKGSHIKMRKLSNDQLTRTVIVPNHYEVSKGTLQAILEQAGISIEEFLRMK